MPTVLLVEDSEDDAFIFKHTLEKWRTDCDFLHFENGAKATEFLKSLKENGDSQPSHVVFLDLKMPVMNGFEVLEWMQNNNLLTTIPVIVLSGSSHQSDRERAMLLGAVDYVVKPVRATDFPRYVERDKSANPSGGTAI